MRLAWMDGRKVMKVGRLLQKPRFILAFLALEGQIFRMILLDMVVHRVLLFTDLSAVWTNKVPHFVPNVLDRGCCSRHITR